MERRFNLIDEPWLPIVDVGRVSLRQVFSEPSYRALGGNPVQKIALMKLLLAIAQAACTPEDEAQWQALGDGYRATVRIITLQARDAVCVPVSAVFPLPKGGHGVFLLVDGRARVTPVDVAARNATVVWARAGVSPGDQVIAYPPASVVDGKRVRVRPGTAG